MQDPNSNQDESSGSGATQGQYKNARRRRIQYELTITGSDSMKKEREKEAELMELKRLKRQLALIQVNILTREQNLKKIENDKMMIDNDIKTLKKKLNEII